MAETAGRHDSHVQEVLRNVGSDIRLARRRRRRATASFARTLGVSRSTLRSVERGDLGVSIGIYARVLAELGFLDRFERVAEGPSDRISIGLGDRLIPQRIHEGRTRRAK